MYLSQLELLKEVRYGLINRNKSKVGVAAGAFLRPHEMVFRDKDGIEFVLKEGTRLFERTHAQHFNDEESDEAKVLGDLMQIAFSAMTVAEIEKEYEGPVERLRKLEDVVA